MLLKARMQPVGFQVVIFIQDTASGIDYKGKPLNLYSRTY